MSTRWSGVRSPECGQKSSSSKQNHETTMRAAEPQKAKHMTRPVPHGPYNDIYSSVPLITRWCTHKSQTATVVGAQILSYVTGTCVSCTQTGDRHTALRDSGHSTHEQFRLWAQKRRHACHRHSRDGRSGRRSVIVDDSVHRARQWRDAADQALWERRPSHDLPSQVEVQRVPYSHACDS